MRARRPTRPGDPAVHETPVDVDRRPRLIARSAQFAVVTVVLLFCAWCVRLLADLAEPGNAAAPAAIGVLVAGTLVVSIVLLISLEVVVWYSARVDELGHRARHDRLTGALAREPVVELARTGPRARWRL